MSIGLYLWQFAERGVSNNPSDFGVFGDYIGGIFGSIAALISIVLLFRTYRSQLDIAGRQGSIFVFQQFEDTLFELLKRQQEMANQFKHWSVVRTRIENELDNFEYDPTLLSVDNKVLIQKRLSDSFYDAYLADAIELGTYYRHLTYILSYIEQSGQDKKKYFSVLQSQMSNEELFVTFFYSLSILGINNMFPIVDKYGILSEMWTTNSVMKFLQKTFYPQTKFINHDKNAKNVVLVGGIHGVGKSVFCDKIHQKFPSIEVLSASEVLKWGDSTKKQVENVDENQDVLIENLQKIISFDKKYVLDGHFCLIENDIVKPIPLDIFEKINPPFMVLIEEDINVIAERLKYRDGHSIDIKTLEEMKEMELRQAINVADSLQIPLIRTLSMVELSNDILLAMKSLLES